VVFRGRVSPRDAEAPTLLFVDLRILQHAPTSDEGRLICHALGR